MLVLAIPIIIWSVTGSYFVLMDIGFIRSDHVVSKVEVIDPSQVQYSVGNVYQNYPKAQQISLKSVLSKAVYQVNLTDDKLLIDAQTGQVLERFNEQQARQIAALYLPSVSATQLSSISLIEHNAPAELSARHLPVWRAEFDDIGMTTLYISAKSGDVVTRRHEYWRLFDLFWKWHIMDYNDGEAIDNQLLFYTSISAFIAVFSGLVLVWQRRKRYVK
ncbi:MULTISPECIES: peptidase [unclassified Shewanella]|uniref:peptidase n=1 Tax=unclassified Shewanella TaxID=196818 RepID=UPI000C84FF01|nr:MULTISPECIES: peptidase [unclassified Shewanella]MDO6620738.1 peptidase [Shewanella sp. 6_MG-2023]MDO6679378.1 peptidase [Shewanella sp. 4_MG-2023]PMH84933.1 peptidase [Shewanella sp. 10N.286.48.B5]